MANEFKTKIKLSKDNNHLLDIFTDDYYLELGTIDHDTISDLLKGKLIEYTNISYFDIMKRGLGSMDSSSKEMQYKLPFMHFYNIVSKNKTYLLTITYGLLMQRKGYKESFAPMVLIPVKMYLENDSIYFQMISKPIENPLLKKDRTIVKMEKYNKERMDDIYSIDKYVMSFTKHQTSNVRLENYLTFVETIQPEIQIHHEMFKLDNVYGATLTEKYSIDGLNSNYNITYLDQNQRNAVAIASKGNSFAITGYEGTGKTTTLISIASDAIKQGKRVLYVSNNDATLSKVYEVFKEKKLESFVTNFSKPFHMINERNHENKKGQIIDYILKSELNEKYDLIYNYEKQLSAKVKNYPIIEVMNELILTPKPARVFSDKIMKASFNLYKYEIKEIINALKLIDEKMPKIGSFKNSHFINIPITHQIMDINQPMLLIDSIYSNYSVLQKEREILETNYGFNSIINYAKFKNLISSFNKLDKSLVPVSWYKEYQNNANVQESFDNFLKAKKIYAKFKEEIEHYQNTSLEIKSIYNVNKMQFDVDMAIKDILSNGFTLEKKEYVDNVLKNYQDILDKINSGKDLPKKLELLFEQLKSKLDFSLLLNDTREIEEVNNYINVFSKGYFSKTWLDYSKSEGILNKMILIETTLDQYEESVNIYSKAFDSLQNIDNNISLLEKNKKDPNTKFKKILVSNLLPHLYYIRKHNLKVAQMKKEYKDLTNANYEYNVHLSNIYKELIAKHDLISSEKTKKQIDNAILSMRSSDILDILEITLNYEQTYTKINDLFDYLLHYHLVNETNDIIEKKEEIFHALDYINVVNNWQNQMNQFLMIHHKYINLDCYLYYKNKSEELKSVIRSINQNKEYKVLFDKLFRGEHSNPKEIWNLINDFEVYLMLFKNAESVVQSFDKENNNGIQEHIKNAQKIISDINDDFLSYIKMFKDSVSKYYYDDIQTVINTFKVLSESRNELRLYLDITDQMKVILKYKLNDLNNYIIDNDKERITNRFKYSYYNHIYQEYIKENPDFLNVSEYGKILDKITNLEDDLIDSNVEVLKISNGRNGRVGKVNHMNFNKFISKNKGLKMLFLSDTNIVNLFLDMTLFDIVLIDDGQLLNANEYNKAIKCGQVVIAGTEQLQTSISNSLISRIRHNAIIPFKYRYTRTPLSLLNKMKNIKGRFYSDVKSNVGISFSKDNYNSLIAKIIKNDKDAKINFFTASNAKAHNIYQVIGNILYDKGLSVSEIAHFFEQHLNVCDLKNGYSIEADYNILDLSTYYDVNDEYISYNMADLLISAGKKLIILDNKNILNHHQINSKFLELITNIVKTEPYHLSLIPLSLSEKISKTLRKSQIETIGAYYPLSLVLEYDNKYYGIILIENPINTEFTVLNEYREFKSNEFPIIVIWLSDLINDYNGVMHKVVKEITS